jgi:predicted enzyme related to lactoylglutathione lyase
VGRAREAVLAAGGRAVGEVVTADVPGAGRVTFTYLSDPEGNIIELQAWSE